MSKKLELTSAEAEALQKLDEEADQMAFPEPKIPKKVVKQGPKKLISVPQKKNPDDVGQASEARCFSFKFYSQYRVLLNDSSTSICKGDPDRQVFLQSPQGRSAVLNLSSDATIDPTDGITFISPRKLLCFDHNRPPNSQGRWLKGNVVVNCCSDVSFERIEQDNESMMVAGRVEGPPPNCGQD
ncbi:MAG: hypothetical protein ACO3A4_04745 [Silvanigrellaceae bacterium]